MDIQKLRTHGAGSIVKSGKTGTVYRVVSIAVTYITVAPVTDDKGNYNSNLAHSFTYGEAADIFEIVED